MKPWKKRQILLKQEKNLIMYTYSLLNERIIFPPAIHKLQEVYTHWYLCHVSFIIEILTSCNPKSVLNT